jgi:hypothetical protein
MSERIDKLFEQALEEFKAENKYATIIVPNPLKEKFAELIVAECAGVAIDNGCGDFVDIKQKLFEHFGVEQ